MTEHRSTPFADLEVRASKREVTGICVPFDQRTDLVRGGELFRRGAFTRTIAERGDRVKLLASHDPGRPLGRALSLSEEQRGLIGTFNIAKTPSGDEALELLAAGALDAFSVGFVPYSEEEMRDGTRIITEARLYEVSLVSLPAYEGALVESVRSAQTTPHAGAWRLAHSRRALTLY